MPGMDAELYLCSHQLDMWHDHWPQIKYLLGSRSDVRCQLSCMINAMYFTVPMLA